MKIYFTASTIKKTRYEKQYKKIVQTIKKEHTLVSGEQIVSPVKLKKDRRIGPQQIYVRELERIGKADCMVAEVTAPSTGVGTEIEYALSHGKPVLALFYKNAEDKLSMLIAGNPSEHLYIEHYDEDDIPFKLRTFLSHVQAIHTRKGKLIVIDGGDGSGKATQGEVLVNYLKGKGINVKYYDFPRYYSSFHGKFVGRFLNGEFGSLDEVSPYLASLSYALDRASTRKEMEEHLANGGYIVCNRYVTSSMAHQAAKLPEKERSGFLVWLDELEYKQHKMPRPDVVIYLYVPLKTGLELTKKKADERKYVKGLDIAEKDIKHRIESEKMYLQLAKTKKNWVKIDCVDEKGNIFSKETIHKKVIDSLKIY